MSASPAPVDACFGSRIVAIDGVKREVLTLEVDPQFKTKRLSDCFDLSNPFVTPALFASTARVSTMDSARAMGAVSPGSDDSLGTSVADSEVRGIMRTTNVKLSGLVSPAQSGQACFGWRWYRSSELSEPIRVVTVATTAALARDTTSADDAVDALAGGGDDSVTVESAEHIIDSRKGRSFEGYTPGHLYGLAHFRTNNLTEKVPVAPPPTSRLVVYITHNLHIHQHTNTPTPHRLINRARRGSRRRKYHSTICSSRPSW